MYNTIATHSIQQRDDDGYPKNVKRRAIEYPKDVSYCNVKVTFKLFFKYQTVHN